MVPFVEPAVKAIITLGTKAEVMPSKITIDTTNETATLSFQDRLVEDTTAPANLGPVPFSTDNPTIATIAVDPTNPLVGDITPVGAGIVNIGCGALVDTSGNPLMESDGVTPFPAVASQALTVDPGAPVGERLSLS